MGHAAVLVAVLREHGGECQSDYARKTAQGLFDWNGGAARLPATWRPCWNYFPGTPVDWVALAAITKQGWKHSRVSMWPSLNASVFHYVSASGMLDV